MPQVAFVECLLVYLVEVSRSFDARKMVNAGGKLSGKITTYILQVGVSQSPQMDRFRCCLPRSDKGDVQWRAMLVQGGESQKSPQNG